MTPLNIGHMWIFRKMTLLHRLVFFGLLILSGCQTDRIIPQSQEEMTHVMESRIFNATNGISFYYRLYRPKMMTRLPIVFYFHGIGQRGSDNVKQLDDALGSILSLTGESKELSAVLVAPQCPTAFLWRDESMLVALREFIDRSIHTEPVDLRRVYATGFSMGGDAVWKLALYCPELLTTILPVCGGPLESMEPGRPDIPEETARLNIWAFNAFDDPVVRPDYAKYIFSKIWSYRIDDNLNLSETVEGGHSYTDVYSDRKPLIWMFSTKKN